MSRTKRLTKALNIFEITFESIIKSSKKSNKLLVIENASLACQYLSALAQKTNSHIPSKGHADSEFGPYHSSEGQARAHLQSTILLPVDNDHLTRPAGPGPHSFRNSAFFFPVDPCRPHTDDILMPLPEGNEVQYTVENGQIQIASFYSLVCLLTSKQGIQDHELSDITMRFF